MDISKIKNTVSDAKVYWKRPMPGKYMPFREIFAYSFGGIGIYFLIYCVQQLTLSSTNVIIGNAIGISPTIMYIIYVISIIISFPATALRATIIDNARSKKGKYRPYIIYGSAVMPSCSRYGYGAVRENIKSNRKSSYSSSVQYRIPVFLYVLL